MKTINDIKKEYYELYEKLHGEICYNKDIRDELWSFFETQIKRIGKRIGKRTGLENAVKGFWREYEKIK
jgi:hypothetical protein